MCTISYYPCVSGGFILTDNRDESVRRPADFPKIHNELGTELWYPKDQKAGGTWFGVAAHKQLICLMNGAFKRHKSALTYRKSRGLVLKELLASKRLLQTVKTYDFSGIEPFFAIALDWQKNLQLIELVWDGKELTVNQKAANQPHLWSSVMTYSATQHCQKEKQFAEFLTQIETVDAEKLWQFHHLKGEDGQEDMLINRGVLQTTSVTQIAYSAVKGKTHWRFEDIVLNQQQAVELNWSN